MKTVLVLRAEGAKTLFLQKIEETGTEKKKVHGVPISLKNYKVHYTELPEEAQVFASNQQSEGFRQHPALGVSWRSELLEDVLLLEVKALRDKLRNLAAISITK